MVLQRSFQRELPRLFSHASQGYQGGRQTGVMPCTRPMEEDGTDES